MSRPVPKPVTKPSARRDRRAQQRDVRRDRPTARRSQRRPARPAWQSPVVLTTVGALLIGLVIIVAAGGLKFGNSGPAQIEQPPTVYTGLTVSGSSVGSATAPVVMQVYEDFQCPACESFITNELPSLLRDYVGPGTLRIEANDLDIIDRGGTESLDLAVGAECAAQQNLYWPYHDVVYWNQGTEDTGYYTPALIDRFATTAGLNMTTFDACVGSPATLQKTVKDRTTAATAAGITSTPTLVVNGQTMVGVQDYSTLSALITQLAAQASGAPASGAPTSGPTASPAAS